MEGRKLLKRTVSGVVLKLLLTTMLTLAFETKLGIAQSEMIYVDDDNTAGPWIGSKEFPYQNISSALKKANVGNTIFVYNGTYYEQVNLEQPITIVGESTENTIIDGNKVGTVIKVTANDVVLSGFTIQNSSRSSGTSYAGIKVFGRRCRITGNRVAKNNIGIFVNSQETVVEDNCVKNNGHGIALYDSSEITVVANNLSENTVGISLAFSSDNLIVSNVAANSSEGGHGITLTSNSFYNTIEENDLIGNYHGMWLVDSSNNQVIDNNIANNDLLGVELASSSSNTFIRNNFINNPTPIRVDTNTPNESICIWNGDYLSGGNYWSDYTDIDLYRGRNQDQLGSDKIWDNPYVIDDNNRDTYPSVIPFGDVSHIISAHLTAHAGADKTANVGSTVFFDASGSSGNIASYKWDFGDGTTGTGVICSHSYYETGTYTVNLTATDAAGNFDTDQLTVTVIADDSSPSVDVPSLWVSAFAGVIVIVMAAALFWKLKGSKKTRRKRMRKLRASARGE